jgi:2-keto-4-pentenoate hydratase/2-oxohepta-3-ene-1,7-dioic acid hydratase in catechol pathway
MAKWLRFEHGGRLAFGTLDGGKIAVHSGDLFESARPTGDTLPLADVRVTTPCAPSKMICLWNNYREIAEKLNVPPPDEPLYVIRAPSSFLAHHQPIRRPKSYDGKIAYEGELGLVIGKTCTMVSEADAPGFIFGYTCVNDITAVDIINRNAAFSQWVRAKNFDTFGAFGPVIATDFDPAHVRVRTILNGQERQNYPVADMIFPPARLVSLISRNMTLVPGDVIACGTSVGVGVMKEPTNTVEVSIEGIGALSNTFEN